MRRLVCSSPLLLGLTFAGCGPGLVDLQGQIRSQVERDKNIFQMCQSMSATGETTATIPVGTDRGAVRRIKSALLGKTPGQNPIEQLRKQLQLAHELEKNLKDKKSQQDTVSQVEKELKQVSKTVDDIASRWGKFEEIVEKLGTFLEGSPQGNLLVALQTQSEQLTRANGLKTAGLPLARDLKEIFRLSTEALALAQALAQDEQSLVTALKSLAASVNLLKRPDVLEERAPFDAYTEHLNHVLRWATALGGLVEDGRRALLRLASLEQNPRDAAKALGQMLLETHSDQVIDLFLLSIEKAIRRVDQAIDKLDEQSYNAASLVTSLALESSVIDEAVCSVAKEAKKYLQETGLSPGSLGARVCAMARDRKEIAQRSHLLPSVYAGLIGAASDLPCAETVRFARSADQPPTKSGKAPQNAESALPGDDESDPLSDSLVRAQWAARVQFADHLWSGVYQPLKFHTTDLPTLAMVPRLLTATNFLIEHREHDLLSLFKNEPFQRENMARQLIISSPFVTYGDVYEPLCSNQTSSRNSPMIHQGDSLQIACSTINYPAGGAVVDLAPLVQAVQQHAWETCLNNAKLDQLAAVQAFCGEVTARGKNAEEGSRVHCSPAGYEASLGHQAVTLKKRQFPHLSTKNKDVSTPNAAIENLALLIQSTMGKAGSQRAKLQFDEIHFIGHASEEQINPSALFIFEAFLAEKCGEDGCKDIWEIILETRHPPTASTSAKREAKNPREQAIQNFVENLRPRLRILAGTKQWLNGDFIKHLGRQLLDTKFQEEFAEDSAFHYIKKGMAVEELVKQFKASAVRRLFDEQKKKQVNTITTASLRLDTPRTEGWVNEFMEEAFGHDRCPDPRVPPSNDPRNPSSNDLCLSSTANRLLSVLRALGAFQIVHHRAPELCDEKIRRCVADGMGNDLAKGRDQEWRSISVVLASHGSSPECAGLKAPPVPVGK